MLCGFPEGKCQGKGGQRRLCCCLVLHESAREKLPEDCLYSTPNPVGHKHNNADNVMNEGHEKKLLKSKILTH